MKNVKAILGSLLISSLLLASCTKENTEVTNSDVALKTDPMSIETVVNPIDSATLTSLKFSTIKNGNVDLEKDAVTLNSIEAGKSEKAFLLFNDDQTKAEIFLPNEKNTLMLDRKGSEGDYTWTDGKYELITWKGYILQTLKQGTKLFAGDVKM